ncbi:MAG TPA: hypothetical protein VJU86_06420 [Pyrinomonadaceae bacterium]|nr:hypothetical protein [Pyrinomonadaceae bacterium]
MKNRAVFATLMMLSLLLCFRSETDAQSRNPQFTQRLPHRALTLRDKPVTDFSSQDSQSIILFEDPNFGGRSHPFGIGSYRLLPEHGSFNDLASSIKVPLGLVVIVYEHSDEGGGYGESVDFLEDQSDLSRYGFDNKISHVDIFAARRGSEVYERNKIENGRVVKGSWAQATDDPINPNPVIAPFKPANVPEITAFEADPNLIRQGQSTTLRWQTVNADRVVIGERYPVRGQDTTQQPINWQGAVDPSGTSRKNPAQPTVYILRAEKGGQSASKTVFVNVGPALPTFCSIAGSIISDRMSYLTRVELHRIDGAQPVRVARAIGGTFSFERVPVGRYQIVPKARFPMDNERPSSLGFFPRADTVTCRPNVPYRLVFRIGSTEG